MRIGLFTVRNEESGVEIEWSATGCAVGRVANITGILDAVEHLISNGVDAVGGVSVIHGATTEMFARHLRGEMPNPSGGIIRTRHFQITGKRS